MKKTALAVAAALLAAIPIPGRAGTNDRLIGTWKLVSMVRDENGTRTDLMGPHPDGYITYGRDGRMMVLIVRGGRSKPAGANPTAAEAAALFDGLVSYAGTYRIDGDKITHSVDISWNESWTGTQQIRFFGFDHDRLVIRGAPSPDPVEGKMSVLTLTWTRLNAAR